MLSISLVLAATSPVLPRPIVGTACPAVNRGARLSNNQVIDGPPAERVILRDDGEQRVGTTTVASWSVGYIYDKGRQVHLLCEYNRRPAIVVRVAKRVATCRYTRFRRTEALACR